jgi:glycosyltransferase involved in cell wall biosynthesis
MTTGLPVRVLELRTVRGTGGGPEKTILLGAAAADTSRVHVTVCYVRDARDRVFEIDGRARQLGLDYVEVVERHSFDRHIWGALRAIVHERKIDIVHSHDYKTDLLAWLLARREGIVPLATAHGWTGHSTRERLVYYPAHKRLLARFPRVFAVSSEIRRELVTRGAAAERVQVLLNGIDHQRFRRDRGRDAEARERFQVPAGAVVVGTIGRLEPQKRFDLLIEAFARVRDQRPALHLLIAGDGSSRTRLERMITERGLDQHCRLLGHIQDVAGLHHALDVFVQSSAYEGTPNVVLEAMAFETPIVATDVGGTAEVCRPDQDGLIVPPGDAGALARAIESALDDESGRRHRVATARRRVETELSFERRVRTLESSYLDMGRKAS